MVMTLLPKSYIWMYICLRIPLKLTEKEEYGMNSPIIEVNSSGAELPAAMNVAPATSDCNPRTKTYTS